MVAAQARALIRPGLCCLSLGLVAALLASLACGPRSLTDQVEPASAGASSAREPSLVPVEPPPAVDEGEVSGALEPADELDGWLPSTTIVIVPLRSFPDDLLDATVEALEAEYAVEVEIREVVDLPKFAYYKPRKRYRAEKLLDFLDGIAAELEAEGRTAGRDFKVLGLTEVDISTTSEPYEDWGIFGLGSLGGTSAVISSHRLKRRPKNREHVRFRVATTAVHEIGHTLGLEHCDEHEARCVMLDAEGGIENTDASTGELGPDCRKKLASLAP